MNELVLAPKRILLVTLDNVGDVVFTSALTSPLHDAFPGATIDVWCKAYTSEIAALMPHVTDVVAADPFWAVPPHRPRPPIMTFLRSVSDIARRDYDVALLSEAPWRAAAAVAATRIPVRIGPARRHNRRFLTHVLDAEDPHKPVVQEQARLLTALGIPVADPSYRLDARRLEEVRTSVMRQLPSNVVACHPFANQRDRCVALAEWIKLAITMQARGFAMLWVGTPAELDEIRGLRPRPKGWYVDELDAPSLRTSAAALSNARLFVGHDSGPLHIAAALGVPVVGIFAPGQPNRTFPQGGGPWRMIARPSPAGITAEAVVREIDSMGLLSST
jgi:ADP-heptose:LPS heptosyltransferase